MTDLQRFKEMYLSFGIRLQEELVSYLPHRGFNPGDVVIWMMQEEHPQFVGYGGFHSGVFFDVQGKFIKQGFWE